MAYMHSSASLANLRAPPVRERPSSQPAYTRDTEWHESGSLTELAHADRIAIIGLAASIPHQVDQPITAMVTNAQAALRLLDCQPMNLEEVRCALASVIQDGNRACKLIGCMRALFRKRPLQRDHLLRVGPLELDLLDRTAKRGDRQIDLRPREFQLLKYMMQRSDKLLMRETLLKEVWNYRVVPETNLVDVHIGRLRRKIDGPNGPFLIRNVRGIGFVLSATPFSHCSPPRAGTISSLAIEQFFAPGCRDAAMVTDNESQTA